MALLARALDRAERLPWPWVPRHGLTVRWYDTWTPDLDSAVAQLPESADCWHEFLAALMRNPSRVRKCTALVTEGDRPVAVIGLRQIGTMKWNTIGGGGVAPRYVAHSAEGYLLPALSALGVRVTVNTQNQAPPRGWVSRVTEYPVHSLELSGNFESYWKESGHLKTVRQTRRRTERFTLEIDAPGATEWTVRGWADRWRSAATLSLEDLIVAADFYRSVNRFHTIRLLDDGQPVSGSTFLVENGGVLHVSTYTSPDYRHVNAGNRVLDAAFTWAAEAGFKHLDLGVGFDYKRRWAPENGMRWSYDIDPWHVQAATSWVRLTRDAAHSMVAAARSVLAKKGQVGADAANEA